MLEKLPSPKEIIAALEKTGFLLEQRVARKIEYHGFNTIVGRAYQDVDMDKSREIDVFGYKEAPASMHNGKCGISLIIECKNTDNPYVIIGRTPTDFERDRTPREFLLSPSGIGEDRIENGTPRAYIKPTWTKFGMGNILNSPGRDSFVGDQLLRLQLKSGNWQADNRSIWDSLIFPLAKALIAVQKMQRPPSGQPFLRLYFPIAVISSPVYVVNTDSHDLEAKEVPWARVTRELQTSSISGNYSIDVVNFTHLDSYIQNRVAAFSGMANDFFWSKLSETEEGDRYYH